MKEETDCMFFMRLEFWCFRKPPFLTRVENMFVMSLLFPCFRSGTDFADSISCATYTVDVILSLTMFVKTFV